MPSLGHRQGSRAVWPELEESHASRGSVHREEFETSVVLPEYVPAHLSPQEIPRRSDNLRGLGYSQLA